MSDTDHIDEDDVLRRMLATKPQPHKPLGKKRGVTDDQTKKRPNHR